MSNSVNYGSQTITASFQMNATAENLNGFFYKALPAGIYNGGLLTKTPSFTDNVTIAPMTVILNDPVTGVAIKVTTATSESSIVLSSTTPYVCLNYEWTNALNNYMAMFATDYTTLMAHPEYVVLGRGVYISGVLQSTFDYSRRDDAVIATQDANKLAFKVQPIETLPLRVYVNPGKIYYNNQYIQFPGGNVDADLPDTTLGRIDLVYVDATNAVHYLLGVDSATPAEPMFPKLGYVVAIITRGAARTAVYGNDITQIAADRQQVTDFNWGVGSNYVNASEIPIGTTITQTVTGGTSWSIANTTTIDSVVQDLITGFYDLSGVANLSVLNRHIDWGTSTGQVNASAIPIGTTITQTVTGGTDWSIGATSTMNTVIQDLITGFYDLSGVADLSILNRHIDWGTGAGQVNANAIPIIDAGSYYSTKTVEYALQKLGTLGGYSATSANTANTLVLRNGGGAFSSGGITINGVLFNGSVSASSSWTINANASFTIPAGIYMVSNSSGSQAAIEINAGGWKPIPFGMIISDGSNVRLNGPTSGSATVYYLKF